MIPYRTIRHILYIAILVLPSISGLLFPGNLSAQPSPPVLVSPANESTGISVTPKFVWRRVTGATSYRIWISKSSSFPGSETRFESGITDTTFTVPTSSPLDNYNGVYYWRVASFNSQGQSTFSGTRVFTTIQANLAPVLLIAPANNAVKQPVYPTLSWRAIPGVAQYEVSISTSATFSGGVNLTTNATSLIPLSQLFPSTDYFWRVRTRFGETDGPWSEIRTFKTHGPPSNSPTLVSPTNLASQIQRKPKLVWRRLADAEFYQIQVSSNSSFSNLVFQEIGITDTTSTLNVELNPLSQYYWRVRGGNDLGLTDTPAAGFGVWSPTRSFITENVKVVLIAPADDSLEVVQPLEFSWKELVGATSYTFELSKNLNFIPFTERQLIDPSADTVRYALLAVLESRTDYYWRVKAATPTGDSDYSEVWSFRTKATGNEPPPAVTLVSPKNDSLNTPLRPRFTWRREPTSSQGYRFQLATTASFETNSLERNALVSDTSYAMNSDLLQGITHYWRVRGISPGGEGEWSEVRTFRTSSLPVVLLSPPPNAVNVPQRPTFTWEAYPNAVSYQIQVDKSSTFEDPDHTLQNITATEARFNFLLDNDSTYYWRVRAVTAISLSSWSEVRKFTVISNVVDPPGTVVLVNPAVDELSVVRKPKFTWRKEPVTQSYTFQLSTSSSFIANELVITIPSILDTTYTPTSDLDESTTYFWRVKGANSMGDGPWSAVRSFTTRSDLPGIVTLNNPQNGAVGISTSPTFTWQAGVNTQQYHIQISLSNVFTTLEYELNDLVGISHSINRGLNLGTLYYWRVRGINSFGAGPWSSVRSFTTISQPPPAIVLQLPANDSIGTPRRPRFEWLASATSMKYMLQLSTVSNFSAVILNYDDIDTTVFQLPVDLAYNTAYFWRVRGINTGGDGAWSQAWKFTVRPVPVSLGEDAEIPVDFMLKQNYPNPFNPTTRIEFGLPETSEVSMVVYDVMGRTVATLVKEVKQRGFHTVDFDAGGLPSGIYFVRVLYGKQSKSIKITLLK